jgi:hypothetical protein
MYRAGDFAERFTDFDQYQAQAFNRSILIVNEKAVEV